MGGVARHAGKSATDAEWWMGATRSADSGSMALHDAYREAAAF
jgi:hypothetical protein